MAEGQFGIMRILRPFVGFTTVYSSNGGTVRASIPIMFTENGQALDAMAGKPGYSPSLLAGLPVPYGAAISIWLPVMWVPSYGSPAADVPYQWRIAWRARNVYDYRNPGPGGRPAYHLATQGKGADDTTPGPFAHERVVIPAMTGTTQYIQSEPSLASGNSSMSQVSLWSELIVVEHDSGAQYPPTWAVPPLLPASSGLSLSPRGEVQQGVIDPATLGSFATSPMWRRYETVAHGDELLIGVTRDGPPYWDFSVANNYDQLFATMFGTGPIGGPQTPLNPSVGVYVSVGTTANTSFGVQRASS